MPITIHKPGFNFKLSLQKKKQCEDLANAEGRSFHNWLNFHGERLLREGEPVSTALGEGESATIAIRSADFTATVRKAAKKSGLTQSEIMRWVVDQMLAR